MHIWAEWQELAEMKQEMEDDARHVHASGFPGQVLLPITIASDRSK